MREKFWTMFVEMKYKERYYWHYQLNSKRIIGIIDTVCLLSSASSIAAWGIWAQYPVVWAIILAVSQIFSVTKPLYPQSKQLIAFKFIIPAISKMLIGIEEDWARIDSEKYSESEITALLTQYRKMLNELENTYVGDIYLPPSRICSKNAEQECKNYFNLYYDVKEVNDND
nr:hypothetical protein [uncultured Agathobaculum sp.]